MWGCAIVLKENYSVILVQAVACSTPHDNTSSIPSLPAILSNHRRYKKMITICNDIGLIKTAQTRYFQAGFGCSSFSAMAVRCGGVVPRDMSFVLLRKPARVHISGQVRLDLTLSANQIRFLKWWVKWKVARKLPKCYMLWLIFSTILHHIIACPISCFRNLLWIYWCHNI